MKCYLENITERENLGERSAVGLMVFKLFLKIGSGDVNCTETAMRGTDIGPVL